MNILKKKTLQLLTIFLFVFFINSCSFEKVRKLTVNKNIAPFQEIFIESGSNEWSKKFHPVVGATPIDIDGDGKMEIFVGGGAGHDDQLFFYKNNKFVNMIAGTGISEKIATHGAISIDIDNDDDTDLILTRNNGIFIYINESGKFTKIPITTNFPKNSTPLNVTVGDIDRDGDGDLYISNFVDFANFRSATFNDPTHAKINILLLNNGDLTFTDITTSSQTASLQNTFLASFVDLNNDGWQDLIVAQNTGQVEIFENLKNNTFAVQTLKTGWGFWMGLAVGDIDKDGDQDLFFTNSGNSVPEFLLEFAGDAKDNQPRNYGWILLRNDGDFNFTDVTTNYKLDDYGFAWGAVFEDLTLNGQFELLVAQNYIKWPIHKYTKLSSKSFVYDKTAFYYANELGLDNYDFAQSPLIVDFNVDGKPDVFWINMDGSDKVARAFLNQSKNNFITIIFKDNANSLGTKVFIETADGRSYTREVYNNIGLSTDQSQALTFGIGKQTKILKVVIQYADGEQRIIENPAINQIMYL